MNRILVAQPVRAFDGIVHVPSPVILVHVSQRSVDAALGCDCMTSRRKEFGYASCVETGFGKAESSTEARTTSTNDNGIVFVVLEQ
jgi:hypothetical protein